MCAGLSKDAKLEGLLGSIAQEITAVEAALTSLDSAEAEGEAQGAEAGAAEGAAAGQAASDGAQKPDSVLQRAGLQRRLRDLEAKQLRLQDALQTQRATAPGDVAGAGGGHEKVQTGGAVLLEDAGLDEELDAASNAALVETERDRLIRLVRCRASPGSPVQSAKALIRSMADSPVHAVWGRVC